jgi:hypothetical protein
VPPRCETGYVRTHHHPHHQIPLRHWQAVENYNPCEETRDNIRALDTIGGLAIPLKKGVRTGIRLHSLDGTLMSGDASAVAAEVPISIAGAAGAVTYFQRGYGWSTAWWDVPGDFGHFPDDFHDDFFDFFETPTIDDPYTLVGGFTIETAAAADTDTDTDTDTDADTDTVPWYLAPSWTGVGDYSANSISSCTGYCASLDLVCSQATLDHTGTTWTEDDFLAVAASVVDPEGTGAPVTCSYSAVDSYCHAEPFIDGGDCYYRVQKCTLEVHGSAQGFNEDTCGQPAPQPNTRRMCPCADPAR